MNNSPKSKCDGNPAVSTNLPPIADRRPKRRTRSLLAGIAAYNKGAKSFPCSIRNFSETGARITLPSGYLVPGRLFLIMVRDRIAHEAVVMWYDRREAGLKFERSVQLSDNMDGELSYLNRLWHAHALR